MYTSANIPHMPSQRSDLLVGYGVNETKSPRFRTHQSIPLIRNGNNSYGAPHFFSSSKRVLLNGEVIHIIVSLIPKSERCLFKFEAPKENIRHELLNESL